MTIGELIAQLSRFPSDLLVVRGDSSGGYEAIHQPRQTIVERVVELLTKGNSNQTPAVIVE